MSARVKNRRLAFKAKKSRSGKKRGILLPLFVVILLVIAPFYILKNSQFWDGKNKLSLAIRAPGGDVIVSTFDPGQDEIINIFIPGDTEVELSRQLGKLRIKNVWQVGVNEGFDGQLLAETITSYFKFPVVAWADRKAEGFTSTNLSTLTKAVFSPYKTNLKIGDRLRLGIFAMRIKNVKRENIKLQQTSYLRKAKLVDGRYGYQLTGRFPQRLLVIFADELMSKSTSRVVILDETGTTDSANALGELIEILGAKVAVIEKGEKENYECSISGKKEEVVARLSVLLSCEIVQEPQSNFDLTVRIGEIFARRF